jgi:hypothetical protein
VGSHGPTIGPVQFRGVRGAAVPKTKVLLVVRAPTHGELVLTGRRCADWAPLRFSYGRARGASAYAIESAGPETGRPGYFLPSKPGNWQVTLTRGTTVVGSFVFCVSASRASPAPCR